MIPFTVSELILATQGKLVQGSKDAKVRSFSADTRGLKRNDFFIPLKGEHFEGHHFLKDSLENQAAGFLVQQWDEETKNSLKGHLGTDTIVIQVKSTLKALQNIARTVRLKKDVPVVGITGSSGKTCTKDMLTSILKEELRVVSSEKSYNNEVGLPLTLLKITEQTRAVVLEMAMRGPGQITELCEIARPNLGVITNIGQAHLEFLGSEQAILEAKAELVRAIPPKGAVVLNQDDASIEKLKEMAMCAVTTFGRSNVANIRAEEMRTDSWGRVTFGIKGLQKYVIVNLPVPGRDQVSNALAAVGAAKNLGISTTAIKNGLEKLILSEMRMEMFSTPEGITILNDAYNANPASVAAALRTLSDIDRNSRKIAVLGDMLELGEFAREAHLRVGRLVRQAGVDYLITVGKESRKIVEEAIRLGMDPKKTYRVEEANQAGQIMKEIAKPGDIILVKASRALKLEKALDGFEKRELHD